MRDRWRNGANGLGEMAREDRPDAASRIGRVSVSRSHDDAEYPDQSL